MGEDSPSPSFIELSCINLRKHITWLPHDTSKEAILQEQLDTKFSDIETRPGWRIVIITGDVLDVLFVWNHAICDGISGKIFHQSLLQYLNSSSEPANIKDGVLYLPKINDFPPAASSAKYPISITYLGSMLWEEYKPSVFTYPAHWAPFRTSPYKTALRSLKFSDRLLQSVVSACRKHGTTLTGLLHAIALVSLAGSVPSEKAAGFRSETAYDMRGLIPEMDKNTVGNICSSTYHAFGKKMVSRLREEIARGEGDGKEELMEMMWVVAVQVRREIRVALEKGTRDNTLGVMKFVKDWRKMMSEHVGKQRTVGWAVTNLGVLDGEGTGDGDGDVWKINEARFTLSAQASGAAITISVVSVGGQSLCVDVSWQDGVIDERVTDTLVTDIKEWLECVSTA